MAQQTEKQKAEEMRRKFFESSGTRNDVIDPAKIAKPKKTAPAKKAAPKKK